MAAPQMACLSAPDRVPGDEGSTATFRERPKYPVGPEEVGSGSTIERDSSEDGELIQMSRCRTRNTRQISVAG